MANKTIYPFGTTGQLPSNIGIINDLITGGANMALSAEMGKFIGTILAALKEEYLTQEEYDALVDEGLIDPDCKYFIYEEE